MPPIKSKEAKILAALGLTALSGCDVMTACLSIAIDEDTADTAEGEDTAMTPCLSPREEELRIKPDAENVDPDTLQDREALKRKLNQEGVLPDDIE